MIDKFVEDKDLGEVFQAPIDVKFSEQDVAIPDLFFISKENKNKVKDQFIDGSPDLIIEIVSTNRKHDYIDKKDLYESFHVKEYWIIDPEDKIVIIHYLKNKKYTIKKKFKSGQTIDSLILKNLNLIIDFF